MPTEDLTPFSQADVDAKVAEALAADQVGDDANLSALAQADADKLNAAMADADAKIADLQARFDKLAVKGAQADKMQANIDALQAAVDALRALITA